MSRRPPRPVLQLGSGFGGSARLRRLCGLRRGLYHAYYLPFTTCEYVSCEYGASANYDAARQPQQCNDTAWGRALAPSAVAKAKVGQLQSRTHFDAWTEMELAATAEETAALLKSAGPGGVLLVTEDRTRAVRMRQHLPQLWAERAGSNARSLKVFEGTAAPGEAYTFQIALYASQHDIAVQSVSFSGGLKALAPRCMNLEGSD